MRTAHKYFPRITKTWLYLFFLASLQSSSLASRIIDALKDVYKWKTLKRFRVSSWTKAVFSPPIAGYLLPIIWLNTHCITKWVDISFFECRAKQEINAEEMNARRREATRREWVSECGKKKQTGISEYEIYDLCSIFNSGMHMEGDKGSPPAIK